MIKKIGILTLGNILSQGIRIIASILLVRMIPQADFGGYQQVELVNIFIYSMIIGAIASSVLYFLSAEDSHAYLSNFIYILASIGVVSGIAIYTLKEPIAGIMNNEGLANLLSINAFGYVPSYLTSIFIPLMITKNRIGEVFQYSFISSCVYLSMSLLLIYFMPNAIGLTLLNLVISWLQFFYCAWRSHSLIFERRPTFNFPLFKKQMQYIAPMLIQSGVGKLGYEIDKAFVTYSYSPREYAIYTVGAKEIPFLENLTSSISSILIPEITKFWNNSQIDEIIDLWKSSIQKTAILFFPLFAFLEIFSSEFITFLYSQKYANSIPLFQIYLLLLPLRAGTYGLIFQAIGKTDYIAKGSFLFLFCNFVMSFLLIKPYGLPGAATSIVIGSYLLAGYYLFHMTRFFHRNLLEILPVKELLPIIFLTLFTTSVTITIKSLFLNQYNEVIQLALGALIFVLLYGVLGYFFISDIRERIGKFIK